MSENWRAKSRRTNTCSAFCFTCPIVPPPIAPVEIGPQSMVFFDQYVIQMDPGIIFGNTTQPFTIETWFKAPIINQNIVILGSGGTGIGGGAPFADNGLSLLNNSLTEWKIDSSGKANETFIFPELAPNTWHYLAVSRDSSAFVQMWIGALGSGSATASTSGRVFLNDDVNDTTNWNLSSPTLQIAAWLNTGRFCDEGVFINNLRITNTNLFSTSAPSSSIPTAKFSAITGTQLLINDGTFIDKSGNQTLQLNFGGNPIVTSIQSPFN
jgi:hypothetical protein